MMQKFHALVQVFYVSLIQMIFTGIYLIIEHVAVGNTEFRLFTLGGNQVLACMFAGGCGIGAMIFKTIAFQNERPSFIALIGYIGLVYGFLMDIFYLNETFTAVELVGVLIILIMCVIVVCIKLRQP